MKRKLTFLTVMLLPIFSVTALAEEIEWDGIVSVDSIEANPGDHFGVAVRLTNSDLAFSAMEIPLKYDSPWLTLDSVSFAGSFKPGNFSAFAYVDAGEQTVKITYVPNDYVTPLPTITAPSGIIGELFFTLSSEAESEVIAIDSVNYDTVIGAGIHWWTRLQFSDNTGSNTYLPVFEPGRIVVGASTGVDDDHYQSALPSEFGLTQNYPNPFNPSTLIEFALPRAGHVKLEVFNVLGQHVAVLADRVYGAGVHQIEFDASGQPSGIYFYRLSCDSGTQTEKMVLLK